MGKISDDMTSQKTTDEKFMHRCLQLGKNAFGIAAPNPSVGCVITYRDTIIGEGYTSAYGGSHAEVNAIRAVKDTALLKKAVLYVTLEPCAHLGKTPPCADLILDHGIPQVVIGIRDPHTKVAGKGINTLEAGGVKVQQGVLEKQCRLHHRRFLTFHEKKRPYIILKWAQSLDGFIAPEAIHRKNETSPYWITNLRSRQLVHKWRSEEQAILVGTNTVLQDNPSLNTRKWAGNSPVRIFLDRDLKVGTSYKLLDGQLKTIVITHTSAVAKDFSKVIYERIDFEANILQQLVGVLNKHQITSLIVEGGSYTLNTFIAAQLWDEARIFTGTVRFEKGVLAPKINGTLAVEQYLMDDQLNIFIND